jgi:hypothetical protein
VSIQGTAPTVHKPLGGSRRGCDLLAGRQSMRSGFGSRLSTLHWKRAKREDQVYKSVKGAEGSAAGVVGRITDD